MLRIFNIQIVHQIGLPIFLGPDPQEQFEGEFTLCRFRFFHPLIHISIFSGSFLHMELNIETNNSKTQRGTT